jgi:uncharacterized protein (DUF885 family)
VTDISPPQLNVKDLADNFLADLCLSDPLLASEEGFSDFDDRIGDLSPAIHEQRARLARETKHKIQTCDLSSFDDQLCADVLADYCDEMVQEFESNDWVRGINVVTNPLDAIHSTCMNIDDKNSVAREKREHKIAEIPRALASFRETLRYGADNSCLPRRTQAAHLAHNCALYANDRLFLSTPARHAFLEFGAFLTDEIIPKCETDDAVGAETYSRFAHRHLGKSIDLDETYEWGWNEIHDIFNEIDGVVAELNPGGTYQSTIELLENDQSRTAQSPDELQEFLQNLMDESVSQLQGKHFEIDPRLHAIEARTIEESGSSAMFYSAPSDDFERPGRTYYPLNGKRTFPLWEEVTTCYHEGLPGHHLHIGAIKCLDGRLSNFQKTIAFNAGEGEGWALYAERLMVELGLSNDPAYIFGMLNASLFRATRVVMDIGMHCGYSIPDDAPQGFPAGEKWNKEISIDILMNTIGQTHDMARDEVYRYLGWIGQAISYKIGERTIRDIREQEKIRLGSEFSLKDFHTRLLGYGHVGLGRLEKLFQGPTL